MSVLNDPQNTRIVREVQLPYRSSLSQSEVFVDGKVQLDRLKQFFSREGELAQNLVQKILADALLIFHYEPNLLSLCHPICVIGDIHGQYYDLIKFLDTGVAPSLQQTKYLFLGDYVDRGLFSTEVMLYILSLKINFPDRVFLIRGNHECRQMTAHFNFRDQCLRKYSQYCYELFMEVFDALPLAAVVNGRYLCLHGGISEAVMNLKRIESIDRMKEIPKNGSFCDILWSDPTDHPDGQMERLSEFNDSRGCAYYFGRELTKKFLRHNQLTCIIRAHEAKQQGYQLHRWLGGGEIPPVITIFSAPNYCDFYNNKGAIMLVDEKNLEIRQIEGSSHPFYLPNNVNIFQFSLGIMVKRLEQIFSYLLGGEEVSQKEVQVHLVGRQDVINLIKEIQRDEADDELQSITLNGKCLSEELRNNEEAMDYMLNSRKKSFKLEKQIDKNNEKRPQYI